MEYHALVLLTHGVRLIVIAEKLQLPGFDFGNCQRLVFSLGVSQRMHTITNL